MSRERFGALGKRASYREGVEYIALNDNPGDGDSRETIAGYTTVQLLAALFGVEASRVAAEVASFRRRNGYEVEA